MGLSLTNLVAHELIPVSVRHEATRSIATPPGWDVSPSQVTSQHFAGTHLLLGGESKVSCPRTQHNDPARVRTRTSRSEVQRANH